MSPAVRIWMESIEGLTEGMIITPNVLAALKEASAYNVMAARSTQENTPTHALEDSTASGELEPHENNTKTPGDMTGVGETEDDDSNRATVELPVFLDPDEPDTSPEVRSASAETLAQEQRNCEQLKSSFEQTKLRNSKFFIKDNLLFKRDHIVGHRVEQLCLPETRIGMVLEASHDSAFAGHMAVKSTMDRIRLSFWFPRMEERVREYCSSCPICQLRAPVKVAHRVPIQAIPRNDELQFNSIVADCIGPLINVGDSTASKPLYNFALVLVDRYSRWPMAYPLRTLSAKAVCDAYIQMFTTFGVPKTISTDCGSNFTSQHTKELLKRLGGCPRFNTPSHPESSGLVERCKSSLKTMIYKLAQDDPKAWRKLLPFTLWALRERPSATTHVSPYMLIFGTTPRGPLIVLKELWIGERQMPLSIGKTTEQYLQDLKNNLELARAYAEFYSDIEQRRMTDYYNLRSMDRRYSVGEKVISLAPDPKGAKLFNRWQGPGTVIEVLSPHSYIVEIDGKKRHLHANRIRKYNERIQQALVNNCAVVFEKDAEFGRVEVTPTEEGEVIRPSLLITPDRVEHLTDDQREQLFMVLDKYAAVFSDKPGLCLAAEHEIKLLPGFVPKRLRAYRIPELLKPEVHRQIRQLLDQGIIEPSESEMASPIVCVMKGPDGKGGVRLAIDYRHVNQHSAGDQFPTPDIQDVLQRVGGSRFISCFDANQGYFQIPLKAESRPISAFVSDSGLFQFRRMSFGLKSASNTFIRCITQVLQPIKEFTETFVDDMAVHSMTWGEHLTHLDRFLDTIQKSGLTLNQKKCTFARGSTVFVGPEIGSGQVKPDPRKLQCIGDLQPPKTKKEVRGLIGFFSYFRAFIPALADIAIALTQLTQKDKPAKVQWGPEQQQALDALKQTLMNAVTLYTINFKKEFGLSVDASGVAVGCCLFQWSEEGVECPVAFASSKLTDTQTRWATIEREAYGVVWALKKFRAWVFLAPVTIFSDHNPLTYLTEAAPRSAKLTRWSLALQEFNLQFKYKPGRLNVVPDFLSRQLFERDSVACDL